MAAGAKLDKVGGVASLKHLVASLYDARMSGITDTLPNSVEGKQTSPLRQTCAVRRGKQTLWMLPELEVYNPQLFVSCRKNTKHSV